MTTASPQQQLKKLANPTKAVGVARFFKTGKGEYGEGDVFLGIAVPQIRIVAKQCKDLSLKEIEKLLQSKIHEERLLGLIILVNQFKKADEDKQKQIFDLYLSNTKYINNWDLVDCSAEYIIGGYLVNRSKTILKKLAQSTSIWKKRIAIMATFQFIKQKQHEHTFIIAKILLKDDHDLIHKAVGWMLREVGKRISEAIEETFLQQHYQQMPRTMLRYAIERFEEKKRKKYLNGSI
ncbi:MAG TPA: DNA alkylation repair protein [Chitinophagaceae bacterium]|nr:DNA alkylation repair protein [Chitinophagaceae bacterium]